MAGGDCQAVSRPESPLSTLHSDVLEETQTVGGERVVNQT